ncbi:portal protein [Bacillus phage Glittering]|uniref:Portal protein n=1 Tax=Bacillus phage Glittering TaxID=2884421 RepID=U5PTW1_9CAUD|nr:portal protein [Bacillus phage Glittering]AGY47196.1 portal protein [Bacillus phage Glittering]
MGFFDKFKRNKEDKTEKYAEELTDLANAMFKEIALMKDTTSELPDQEDYNPTDFSLEVYEKMLTDGQVKSALDMIKLSATAKGFTVTGDDDESKKYADFINENFEMIRGNMEDVLKEIMTALEYGYSCTEKVFEYKDGKIMLKKLKTLDPYSVAGKTDRFGDLMYVKQRIGSKTIKIPADKVLWYAHQKRFGNIYGQSRLRTVYKHWFIKDKMYRFANIAYERYGTPLLVGSVEDKNDVPEITRLLRNINGMTGLGLSGGADVKAIQTTNADFIGYIEHHDRKIMESLLVPPSLLGLSRGQSGSYALSSNQFDIFMIHLESIQRDIKSLIEEEIIRPLVDLNFPNVTRYPAFTFKPLADRDIDKLSSVFEKLINASVIAPEEDWLREELGFPVMSKEVRQSIEERKQKALEAFTPKGDSEGSNEEESGSQEETQPEGK